ncbi:MAG: molybdopterin oxidoreductase, partial [Myxococcales bacterium]|nr:molybdopterin oxidoreductase [Myxococcales bacterium]
EVKTLLILDGNPVYDAPADLDFGGALGKVEFSLHLGTHRDETSARTTWHVPLSHPFEAWGDARSGDGTYAVQQPLIAPLHESQSVVQVWGAAATGAPVDAHAFVKTTFSDLHTGAGNPPLLDIDDRWNQALHAGALGGIGRFPEETKELLPEKVSEAVRAGLASRGGALSASNLEVTFASCAKMGAGEMANNPWLLELPDGLAKVTWDNVAFVSPKTAKELGVKGDPKRSDVVRISRKGAKDIDVALWELPGHADHSITLTLGWGRTRAGRYGNGQGFDVYPLRTTDGFDFADGATLKATGRNYFVSQTQEHGSMEGRAIVLENTVAGYRENPEFASYDAVEMPVPPLWKEVDYSEGHKWGLSIDLTTCTGCNACVIACQAENNLPNVGKRQVAKGREMYWIRIDRYFVGDDADNPQVAIQP